MTHCGWRGDKDLFKGRVPGQEAVQFHPVQRGDGVFKRQTAGVKNRRRSAG